METIDEMLCVMEITRMRPSDLVKYHKRFENCGFRTLTQRMVTKSEKCLLSVCICKLGNLYVLLLSSTGSFYRRKVGRLDLCLIELSPALVNYRPY